MFGLSPIVLFVAVLGAATLAAMVVVSMRAAIIVFGLMLFSTSISFGLTPDGDLINTWLTPLQLRRNELFIACGAMMYLAVLVHFPKFGRGTLGAATALMVALPVYAGLIRVVNGYFNEGALSIGLALATVPPIMFMLPNLVRRREESLMPLRAISLVAVAWIFVAGVQYLLDPGVLTPGASSRFQGLSGNPQFASVFLATTGIVTLWLSANDRVKTFRLGWLALAGVICVCLLWTGSRTGALLFTAGAMFIYASRLGQLVLLAPLVLGAGFLFFRFFLGGDVEFNTGRLTDTTNTRAVQWNNQINSFISNPLFGTGDPDTVGGSENSYLAGAASYGIFYFFLMIALMIAAGTLCLKLYQLRKFMDKRTRSQTDLVLAFMAMYFGGALLEGYIIARVSPMTIIFVLMASLGMQILIDVRARLAGESPEEYTPSEWDEGEPHDYEDGYADEGYHDHGYADWEDDFQDDNRDDAYQDDDRY